MTRNNTSKINSLLKHPPAGVLLTNLWLKKYGITGKLAWWYVHAGWLEKVVNTLYKREARNVEWYDVVLVLQQQLKLPVHVGGKTALQLLGKSHYVPVNINQFDLYVRSKVQLPAWLNKIPKFGIKFNLSSRIVFNKDKNEGIIVLKFHKYEIQLSSPERAILELLSNVPQRHTYEEAYLLMENLSRLRPELVQTLLKNCKSIKATRLFLHLAEKCQHDWMEELDIKKLQLGKGKRKIGSGGLFDAKYQISVPKITTE